MVQAARWWGVMRQTRALAAHLENGLVGRLHWLDVVRMRTLRDGYFPVPQRGRIATSHRSLQRRKPSLSSVKEHIAGEHPAKTAPPPPLRRTRDLARYLAISPPLRFDVLADHFRRWKTPSTCWAIAARTDVRVCPLATTTS